MDEKKNRRTPLKETVRLEYFKPCMVETRSSSRKKNKKKRKRNEWMPAPSGDFSFFPNWGIESRILLSYKPLSLSHHPRDVNHFQPPGSSDGENQLSPSKIETGFSLI